VPTTWATNGKPLNDATKEMLMVTQLDEERHAYGRWPRPIFKRHKNGTRILQTSYDVR